MNNLYMIDTDVVDNLEDNPKLLDEFIAGHKAEFERYERLERYYLGKHDILFTPKKKKYLKDNKVIINFCKLLTTTKSGYFMGKGVTLQTKDQKYSEALSKIDDENDVKDKNMELANTQSIKGTAYEIVYVKPEQKQSKNPNKRTAPKGKVRYAKLNPEEMFLVHDMDLEPDVVFAVRPYMIKDKQYVEIYSDNSIKTLLREKESYLLIDEVEHFFGDVPVSWYHNNSYRISDFEPILTIQDDYNEKVSDISNELSYFNDPLMSIKGLSGIQKNDLAKIQEMGAVLLEGDGEFGWVVKPMQDDVIENHKKTLKDSIFMIGNFPDWSSEKFAGNVSGVAIAYKLINLESVVSESEKKFEKGLMRRYRLITNYLNKFSNSFDIDSLTPKFSRNVPQNLQEIVLLIEKLSGFLSERTLMGLLPFIEDIQEEMDTKAKEKGEELNTDEMKGILSKYKEKPVVEAEEEVKVEEEAV